MQGRYAHARLNTVHVRARNVVHGTVRDVTVTSGTGTAPITYPALTALIHDHGGAVGSTVTVAGGGGGGGGGGGQAKLTGPLGLSLDGSGAIVAGGVRINPDPAALASLPTFLRSETPRRWPPRSRYRRCRSGSP